MDNESTARLKFDRRLAARRGWVEPDELEQELASLPDVSDKMVSLGDADDESAGAPEASTSSGAAPATTSGGGTPGA